MRWTRTLRLQWGRGLVTTETRIVGLSTNWFENASMGPWSGDHGNVPVVAPAARLHVASMGPWSGDHGNEENRIVTSEKTGLQWGRGLVTTETQTCRSWRPPAQTLQWGRGLVTTETIFRGSFCTRVLPLQWGRGLVTTETHSGSPGLAADELLQWGRGLVTTETTREFTTQELQLSASMGPWSGDHGNVIRQVYKEIPKKLQWGRGLVTTETVGCFARAVTDQKASMGPWSGDHGNLGAHPAEAPGHHASMGPWSGDHGNSKGNRAQQNTRLSFNGAVVW